MAQFYEFISYPKFIYNVLRKGKLADEMRKAGTGLLWKEQHWQRLDP